MSRSSDAIIERAVEAWVADDIECEAEVANYRRNTSKRLAFILLCLVFAIAAAGCAMTVGDYHVGFWDTYKVVFDHLLGKVAEEYETADYLIWGWRLPRICTGLLAGAGLGAAGAVMQSILRNPLADPYTTGISSGAGFGATLVIGLGVSVVSGAYSIVVGAFLFSLIPMGVILLVSKMKGASPTTMIMAGIAVMYIFNAMTTMIKLWVDPEKLSAIFAWSVGSIDGATWAQVYTMTFIVLAGFAVLQLLSRRLNVLSTGDESSRSMGVDAGQLRLLCLLVVSFLAAGVVSFTGLIGFVGLVGPHVSRLVIGSDSRFLIPASAAFGAALLTIADVVGRVLIENAVIQVGVITAFIGGPLFLWLIIRQKKVRCMPIISVNDVRCGYGEGREVLGGVSFRIDEPEYVCIIGPNGVGKSTLIKVVDGIIKPSSGNVEVYGKDVSEYGLRDLSKIIGYVPVTSSDFNVLSVLDTVLIGRYSRQRWRTTREDIAIAYKSLKAMEIEGLAERNFNEISAGQRQKASISRGLVQEPDILMLDEPTANLDVRHQIYVSAFLRKLSDRAGMTCFTVSHDLNLAAKYATKVIVLRKPGVVYAIGDPKSVITERMVRDVYEVECDVIDDRGTPHVMLQGVMEEGRRGHCDRPGMRSRPNRPLATRPGFIFSAYSIYT